MDVKLAHRVHAVKPSPTLAVSARASALKAAGESVLNLAAGEPDFDTPEHVKAAAIEAIRQGFTKYTPVDGTAGLKRAVVGKFRRENELDYEAGQVLVSAGAKHSIYNLMQALLNPGDEVIVPAPYWVSYPDMARLAGAEPVILRTGMDEQFKISRDQLRGALGERTRLVILNSPSNPTGAHYTPDELRALGEVLLEHPEVVVCSDDIYEHILWVDGGFTNILNVCPELAPRTVVVNGVSKSYAMTGWRIGYAAGPRNLIKAMLKIQSQSTSNPTSIAQVAAQAALEGDQSFIAEQCAVFKSRHDFLLERLNALPGVRCRPSEGTFYIFPDMNGLIERMQGVDNDIALAELFLERTGCAMVPGSAFGAPGYMRISFAVAQNVLEQAMERMTGMLG